VTYLFQILVRDESALLLRQHEAVADARVFLRRETIVGRPLLLDGNHPHGSFKIITAIEVVELIIKMLSNNLNSGIKGSAAESLARCKQLVS
jgi:hypothetical protein